MKKFWAWMKDSFGYPLFLIVPLLGYMYASVLFKLNNFYSTSVHLTSGWWHLVGWVLTGTAVWIVYTWTTRDTDRGDYIGFGAVLALSLCAFAGFSF